MLKSAAALLFAVSCSVAQPALAQTGSNIDSGHVNWRRVGGSTFEAGLASPATGPVTHVWFSADGGKLYATTLNGKTWATADYENWFAASGAPPHMSRLVSGVRAPEKTRVIEGSSGMLFALGTDLYRSGDNGATWTNLTAFRGRSIIGPWQSDVAMSPRDPEFLVVANAWGVWASHDGGLSWCGLNENLPNLSISEIESVIGGVEALLPGLGKARLAPGAVTWEPLAGGPDYSAVARALNAEITAFASSGDTAYAGSSDGRLWYSRDGQITWNSSGSVAGGRVERIFIDPNSPSLAFVASAAKSRSLLRTMNAGVFWDDITGPLAGNPSHAIVSDRASNSILAATDRGIFIAHADLNASGTLSTWSPISGLPVNAVARDLKLSGSKLYAAVDGYGLYSTQMAFLTGASRVVSSADLAEHAAAPGSLFSVLGAKLTSARAGSRQVPVLAASNEESQIQVPFEATGDRLSLSLDGSASVTLPLRTAAPAIFVDQDDLPVVMDASTGLTVSAKLSLHPRARIQLLATGLGKTTPAWPTALPAPAQDPPAVVAKLEAYLGNRPLQITRATLAPGYVGLYLVELELPTFLDEGPAELHLVADSVESNRVSLYLSAEN